MHIEEPARSPRLSSYLDWLRFRWPVLLLGLATIGAYGAVYYSFGVLLAPMQQATGWSASALTGGFSLSVLVGGAAAVLAGRALDRAGSTPVLAAALVLGCAALFAASYARGAWEFVALWTVGGGAVAGGLYYNVTMAATARLYPDQRAAAFGVLTLLGALAGPIFYPLAGWLVSTFEWRVALRFLVLALALCVAPSALFVRTRSAQPPADPDGERPPTSMRAQLSDARTLFLLAMIGGAAFSTSALTLHQVPAMEATGLSLAAASTIAGTRGLFQFGGRVFLAPLVARFGVRATIAMCYGGTALGAALLAAAGPLVLVLGFIACTGVAVGLLSPLHGLFATEVYGEERLGTLMGVQQVVAALGGAAGPWVAGLAFDATSSYAVVYLAVALVQLSGVGWLAAQVRARAPLPVPGTAS